MIEYVKDDKKLAPVSLKNTIPVKTWHKYLAIQPLR